MRLRCSTYFKKFAGSVSELLMNAVRNKDGNIAFTFAIVSLPVLLGIGASIDYVRAYNTQAKMQIDLDAALIAAIKDVDSLKEDEIKEKVEDWFAAQTELNSLKYSLSDTSISVSKTDKTIKAIATGNVATTFMGLANINSVNVSVASSVAGPATSHLEVYIVLDKSASMLLASTSSGQASMRSMIKCEFACHDTHDPVTYKGTKYSTYYAFAKAKGIQLRTDVALDAVEEVLDMIDDANASTSHIKVGLYSISTTANEVLGPTSSISKARTLLSDDASGLTSATSVDGSYFNDSLPALQDLVGEAGDGSSASKPLKLVLLLTDGLQSERNWVLWWNEPNKNPTGWNSTQTDAVKKTIQSAVAPLNPDWCSGMKKNQVTIGILYTEYLPITKDWGYNETVGLSMSSSKFSSIWGGKLREDVPSSTTRQAYLPYALKDCATSEDLFLSANDPDEIESGLSSLFEQYLSSVRLTQ